MEKRLFIKIKDSPIGKRSKWIEQNYYPHQTLDDALSYYKKIGIFIKYRVVVLD